MTLTADQFTENLARSGLMTAAEIQAFQDSLPPGRRPKDAQTLAQELVRAGRLTKFQATAVYQGKTKGLVFGEYVVLDKIGQGGMGVVLKAQHRKMKRLVAVKMLPAGLMGSPEAVKRFYHEVEAAARLSHPNIVAAYDAGEHEGTHYLVMEYVEGQDLARLVHDRGPLPVAEAVGYLLQAAEGLAYAHGEGIVHRDIKPANLLVDRKGQVKILDMGLARIQALGADQPTESERLTQTGQVMGTCDYMAPEQAEDTRRADHRADIYALGCTLYRLLIGKPPYSCDTMIQTLLAHREAPIPSLCTARREVPEGLEAVYQRMLAKRPADRYQSMAEVISDLKACISGPSPSSPPVVPQTEDNSSALSFLQDLTPAPVATRTKLRTAAEDTLDRRPERDTSRGLGKRVARAAQKNPHLLAAIGGGTICLVLLVVLLLILGGRSGTKNKELPGPRSKPKGHATNEKQATPRRLPVGQWIPLLTSPDDLAKWEALWGSRADATYENGLLKLSGTTGIGYPWDVADAAIRAKVKLLSGQNIGLHLRCGKSSSYCFWFRGDVCGVGAGIGGPYRDLKTATSGPFSDDFVQMEFSAIGGRLTASVNGSVLLEIDDPTFPHGLPGVAVYNGAAALKDIEIKVLKWNENAGAATADRSKNGEVSKIEASPLPNGERAPPPAIAPLDAVQAKQHQEAWAKHLGVPVERTNSIGMSLVLVPPGEFLMGSPDSDNMAGNNEKPQHRVRISRPFWLGKCEVTQAEFKRVMGGNPSQFKGEGERPVEIVAWIDAQDFCRGLSTLSGEAGRPYGLPAEAQWEYACRAGSTTRWCFGDDEKQVGEYAWFSGSSLEQTHLIGQNKPNAWGLCDMHGNVGEWCQDGYGNYAPGTATDPIGPSSAPLRVTRGGGWDARVENCRSAFRFGFEPTCRRNFQGFRVCRPVE